MAYSDAHDRFDLARFMVAQEKVYNDALAELKSGRKRTHWMWYIFPQIDGLGKSLTAKFLRSKAWKRLIGI